MPTTFHCGPFVDLNEKTRKKWKKCVACFYIELDKKIARHKRRKKLETKTIPNRIKLCRKNVEGSNIA